MIPEHTVFLLQIYFPPSVNSLSRVGVGRQRRWKTPRSLRNPGNQGFRFRRLLFFAVTVKVVELCRIVQGREPQLFAKETDRTS